MNKSYVYGYCIGSLITAAFGIKLIEVVVGLIGLIMVLLIIESFWPSKKK